MRLTRDLGRNAFSRGCPAQGAELAEDLERLCALHGPDTIAAVIVEPLAGATGVLPPPVGYLQKLREICDRHGILLIFDEVISGFGRLGGATAAEVLGVTPDIMTLAKGLTNAAVPMGAVAVRDTIYEAALENAKTPIELFHGYTYSGHPLAAAAGLATLEIYAEEQLFQRAAAMAPVMEAAAHSLRGRPHVIDVRNLGLVVGIELAARPGKPGARGKDALMTAGGEALMIRAAGDVIALSPPLIISEDQIGEIFDILSRLLDRLD